MPIIKPFSGTYYNPDHISDLSAVVAPPYDVISTTDREKLLQKDPHNIIRLILGKSAQEKGKPRQDEEYRQAATTLAAWREKAILVADRKPALYYLEEEFTILGITYCRKGFIGLLQLTGLPHNAVLPHEKTMSGPKEDRLKLMTHCQANFSQILTLYDDPDFIVERELQQHRETELPFIDLSGHEGIDRRLWQVTDPAAISRIQAVLAPQSLFIADGHHRFETAMQYRQLRLQQEPRADGREPYNYVMVYCSNTASSDLAILPTHRQVSGYPKLDPASFIEKAGKLFQLTPLELQERSPEAMAKTLLDTLKTEQQGTRLVAVVGNRPDCYLLSLTPEKRASLMENLPAALASLDVSVLHHLLFGQALQISAADMETQRYTSFTQDAAAAVASVMGGENQLAVLLRPTAIEQVKQVAAAGEKMPQKSTFFYPKLVTGLLLYLFS
ncbi:MAG: DUF1015 domain-containing protein [Deltaproteobacteria bacterium]|nr:DUF1015 domain-containing protein [Candidatus Anaeroferrophillus wilburensis]MBN2889485.1 DUF1015 domain-containing protein [Deltaproteobacteria bacterium]